MNGEIPSVPIITLAGVSSLTNLLPQLPLPTPLPHTVNKSLLYHPVIASEAQQYMGAPNDALVQQLVDALRMTNSDHVELRDNLQSDINDGEVPDLLKSILSHDPDVFKSGSIYHGSGFNFVSHAELYPNNIRSVDEDFNSIQGVPSNMNGPIGSYSDQSYGISQQTSSDYGFMMNGNSPSLQQHSNDVAMMTRQFASTIPSHSNPPMPGLPANCMPPVGAVQGMTNSTSRGPTKSFVDCSPAQAAAAAPPTAAEPRAGVQPVQYFDSYGNGLPKSSQFSSCQRDPTKVKVLLEPLTIDQMDLVKKHHSKKSSFSNVPNEMKMLPTVSLTRIDDKKHRMRDGYSHYNVVQSPENAHRLKIKISKTRMNDGHRGTKRRHSDDEDDDQNYINIDGMQMTMKQLQDYHGEFATSLTERVKRGRRKVSYRENESDDDERSRGSTQRRQKDSSRYDDDSQSDSSVVEAARRRKKERKQRRMMETSGTVEELMETPTFKKFYTTLEFVLDTADDMDLAGLRDDDDDGGDGSMESVVAKNVLAELCSEAAKLKSMGVMNQVPYEKLIKILTILQYSIKQGCRLVPPPDGDGENEEEQLLRDLTLEQVLMALDASLIAMHIMTSKDMPKEVFIEDVIERVVRLTKMQLHNTIYPEFDPVYRIDPRNKSSVQSNIKMKRAKASGAKDRATLSLYNKLADLTLLLADLIEIQELTDTIILQTSSLSVSPFFVENIPELQLNTLKLVTNIFSRYEKHRQLILEDILSSLARLPSSKKNLRSYRLNADEQIQMVTALALQLIQCVVKLPGTDDDTSPDQAEDVESHGRKKKKVPTATLR